MDSYANSKIRHTHRSTFGHMFVNSRLSVLAEIVLMREYPFLLMLMIVKEQSSYYIMTSRTCSKERITLAMLFGTMPISKSLVSTAIELLVRDSASMLMWLDNGLSLMVLNRIWSLWLILVINLHFVWFAYSALSFFSVNVAFCFLVISDREPGGDNGDDLSHPRRGLEI